MRYKFMMDGRFGGRVGNTMQTPVPETNARSIRRERVQVRVARGSTLPLTEDSTGAIR